MPVKMKERGAESVVARCDFGNETLSAELDGDEVVFSWNGGETTKDILILSTEDAIEFAKAILSIAGGEE